MSSKTGKDKYKCWQNRFEFYKSCSQHNFFSITQLFSNFPTIKNRFLLDGWLEISERLGNCRLCFLGNEIRTNVNASSWITYEQNSPMELFLLILISSPSISLLRHISSIPCQLKPCFPSNSAYWEIRHSDRTIP